MADALSNHTAGVLQAILERRRQLMEAAGLTEEGLAWEIARRDHEAGEALRRMCEDYQGVIPHGVPSVCRSLSDFKVREGYPTVQAAREATNAWLSNCGPGLLVLAGSWGVGKSHLAQAAAAHLWGMNKQVMYRIEADLFDDVRQAMRVGDAERWIAEVSYVPWLVIDDLGVSALSDTMRAVLDQVIDARWRGAPDRRTMVTTNLKSTDLPGRIASRLADRNLGVQVQITAPDYRLQP